MQTELDTGRSSERTDLAWQRTGLATAAGAAVVARLTLDRIDLLVPVLLGVAVLFSMWVVVMFSSRTSERDAKSRRRTPPDGRPPWALTVAICLIACVEMAATLRA
ncbi:DUF202 domain-containing protein [Nocardioides soli]|uniref:Uncharacterized membrane protein YidH (DUF202 family) n=1 Tax=Nocardioides soli TaxID=1036020 RepID=A0A7W4W234_9ACTN|nr:DUF202 domain-containing protein [Nocardioides soli]MBB3045522.1 uncharacterized membrane protein YidH (DUF202 family) [Nocardioides soli]